MDHARNRCACFPGRVLCPGRRRGGPTPRRGQGLRRACQERSWDASLGGSLDRKFPRRLLFRLIHLRRGSGLQCGGGFQRGSLFFGGLLRSLGGIFLVNLGKRLDQLLLAPRRHIREVDSDQMLAIGPSRDPAEAESKPADPESDLDINLCRGWKSILSPQAATAQAEIDDAAGQSGAVLYQQEMSIFIHSVAGVGAALFLRICPIFRVFHLVHFGHRLHFGKISALQPDPMDAQVRFASPPGPSGGHTGRRRWWFPETRCRG